MFIPNHRQASNSFDSSIESDEGNLLQGRVGSSVPDESLQSSFVSGFLSTSRPSGGIDSSYARNDDEDKLIEAVMNANNNAAGQPLNLRDKRRTRVTLRATLVTDPSKNIMIDVKMGDTLRYLQVVIGD